MKDTIMNRRNLLTVALGALVTSCAPAYAALPNKTSVIPTRGIKGVRKVSTGQEFWFDELTTDKEIKNWIFPGGPPDAIEASSEYVRIVKFKSI